jgi:hypothetical protein
MSAQDNTETPPCPLCRRPLVPGPSIDEHHLVPRTYKGRETVTLHRVCHAKIHAVLSEKELRDHYHTVARLREHPEIAKFLGWVRKKHPEFIDGHATKRRRR